MGAPALEIKEKDKDSIKALIAQNEKRMREAWEFHNQYSIEIGQLEQKQKIVKDEIDGLMRKEAYLNELLK